MPSNDRLARRCCLVCHFVFAFHLSKCGLAVVEIHVAFNAQAKTTAHVLKLRQCEVAKLTIQALYITKEHVVAVGLLFCLCDVPCEAATGQKEFCDYYRVVALAILRIQGIFCKGLLECFSYKFHTFYFYWCY